MSNRLIRYFMRKPLMVIIVVLIFPIVVGFVYYLPLPQFVAIDSGQFISYYAIAFGLIGSMLVYLNNREAQTIAKERKAVPDIIIDVYKNKEGLEGKITNAGPDEITNIMFFDVDLVNSLPAGQDYKFNFGVDQKTNGIDIIKVSGIDDLETDDLGFPSYIPLYAEDSLGRGWSLVFERRGEQASPKYPLSSIEVIVW